ncbi:hypothetical protein HPP92_000390 [Vanilla planifolia]|uniref:Peptide-methionine (R)-S-oxide reductase n=1 Tax=Vanilla planifolia TaxID=51239 RepID=A0A835VCJ8_VANPL|nr:hypothetical protein HPP92_000390 [Vanilla planifolia]
MASPGLVQKSEEEWRAILSPEQFRILRLKGTEWMLMESEWRSPVQPAVGTWVMSSKVRDSEHPQMSAIASIAFP